MIQAACNSVWDKKNSECLLSAVFFCVLKETHKELKHFELSVHRCLIFT